ncbi:sugar phosphate nucleotidyltransferase [Mesorhizobium sp. M0047]|uniref:sugar phosphate nucleotidyltransferase n=1 Tax=Mesorhizobium sp. M0047 TaxID=2956859 RepID=UPI003338D30B
MLGIVPAAGRGSRIQPLGFSKELLPVGSRIDGAAERPCAVSEYLVRRMVRAGTDKICFIIGSEKSDILEYYAAGYGDAVAVFVVQPSPVGLCDAIFRAVPLVASDETVLIGLPDTIWFPEEGFSRLPDDKLSFLLFPVDRPELFDAVILEQDGRVQAIQVKQQDAATNWIWGAFKMPGHVFHQLAALWRERDRSDEYIGTLVNAYLAAGGEAFGVKAGTAYVDVGTFNGYRAALRLLENSTATLNIAEDLPLSLSAHAQIPLHPGEGG